MEIIKKWVESIPYDFKIDSIDIHNVYENAYRVNVYARYPVEAGSFVRKTFIGRSFFLRLSKENVVTDHTIKPSGIKSKY